MLGEFHICRGKEDFFVLFCFIQGFGILELVQVASHEWMDSMIWPELMEKIFIRRVLSPSVGHVCIMYLCAFQLLFCCEAKPRTVKF